MSTDKILCVDIDVCRAEIMRDDKLLQDCDSLRDVCYNCSRI